MPKRIEKLTEAQKARFDEWADKWIEIGLRTGPADREKFEAAAAECYRFAGLEWPNRVIWVSSPMELALSVPKVLASLPGGKEENVSSSLWTRYIGGQFWAGGWWWGPAWTSFFREVCDLELDGDLWARARAYEATVESACWWFPHTDFVIVSERPTAIHRELINSDILRGWNSHRLHCADGPAVAFSDGWGVYAWHGVIIPFDLRHVIEAPEQITVAEIEEQENVEIRRVMLEHYGFDRYLTGVCGEPLQQDDFGRLWRREFANDEPLVMVEVTNAAPEPDGSYKRYMLRVPPTMTTAHEAVAWTFGMDADSYHPTVQT